MTKTKRGFVVDRNALYLCDNGAVNCGAHLGFTASVTGRDLSGSPVDKLDASDDAFTFKSYGRHLKCQVCGLVMRDLAGV